MMLDDLDDDIADEDLLSAFEQVSSRSGNNFRSRGPASLSSGQKTGSGSPALPSAAAQELRDLPSDAFSSPEPLPQPRTHSQRAPPPNRHVASRATATPRTGLQRSSSSRQTTLWGTQLVDAPLGSQTLSQTISARPFRADTAREEPSHHQLNRTAMETWVYPTNLGAIRDYQFSIVKNSLFNNTLVALPTGLGKTFIAATVMLNFYRWTETAKIVFVAPTKPLVAQQVTACYSIAGIPRSDTTLLTGEIQPVLRVDEWQTKRVFFMTPQTLLNDISHGYADPKTIVLLVIDEAHRAVGEYAYAKVTKLIRRYSKSFRVLALTATPGSKIETVQEVIDNLGISHCEIRTEESIDIRQYVHDRNTQVMVLDPSDEMNLVGELFSQALKPLVDKLSSQNIYYGRNPMALTAYGLMQAQREWFATRGRSANQGVQFMMRATFSVLTSIAHSIKLLNFHGIKPFYDNLFDFRNGVEGKGEQGSKYKRQLIEHPSFQEMMNKISGWLKMPSFVGHPKLTELASCVLNHFMDQGDATRIIVFSEYRDSAEGIVCMLNKHRPLVKASVFVGQADGKRGEGMKQAQQIDTIDRFKRGDFNVLVATSIGEEGLDIGQVDLIVCYDSSASPIRMLQRMGRTGRKRAGNIVLLLMRGKEEEQFAKSKDSYEKMQHLICEGSRFNFRFDLSTRIVPRDIRPEVDKRLVDIPIENTQNQSLPEPKKGRVAPGKKKPPKKFHMPDGVETGFQKLTHFIKPKAKADQGRPAKHSEVNDAVPIPDLRSVMLTAAETEELDRSYRDLPFNHSMVEETDMPSMTAYPELQRRLQSVVNVKHGEHTRRCVRVLGAMGLRPDSLVKPCRYTDDSNFLEIPVREFINSDGEEEVRGARVTAMSGTRSSTNGRASPLGRSQKSGHKRKFPTRWDSQELLDEEQESRAARGTRGQESDSKAPPSTLKRPKKAPRLKDRTKGRRGKQRGTGINSDEIGDDCEQDGDLFETSDSDDGEDLVDFVVADDASVSVNSQATPFTSSLDKRSSPPIETEPASYVPMDFSATQDSQDMPDVDALVNAASSNKHQDLALSRDATWTRRAARRNRRRMSYDSDDD
ncbi:hypothetical protein CDD82_3749 [Ophiocordyceps australis]|uniref:ATP-dependent DNA helicase n=1 Tax=Ophiocordyceps australis TaxID=1399860 RepID=A0A2C5ZA88_9HYPO|nr:hypothetical protein CDD82_3749 [Ophiocordyceps australis]